MKHRFGFGGRRFLLLYLPYTALEQSADALQAGTRRAAYCMHSPKRRQMLGAHTSAARSAALSVGLGFRYWGVGRPFVTHQVRSGRVLRWVVSGRCSWRVPVWRPVALYETGDETVGDRVAACIEARYVAANVLQTWHPRQYFADLRLSLSSPILTERQTWGFPAGIYKGYM